MVRARGEGEQQLRRMREVLGRLRPDADEAATSWRKRRGAPATGTCLSSFPGASLAPIRWVIGHLRIECGILTTGRRGVCLIVPYAMGMLHEM